MSHSELPDWTRQGSLISQGRVYHVSGDGDDASGSGDPENPLGSLAEAAKRASPGDSIRLAPGLHKVGNRIESLHGEKGAPIRIGGEEGKGLPVFQGGGQAIHFSKCRYLIVEHFRVEGATGNGINCDDGGEVDDPDASRHLVFNNIEFSDIGRGGNQDALKLSGLDDFWVVNCRFENTSSGGSGIDMVGCHQGVIRLCRFKNTGSNAIQCKGGTFGIKIHANRIEGGKQRGINMGGSTGFSYFRPSLSKDGLHFEAEGVDVMANLFIDTTASACFVGAVRCRFVNNTVIRPKTWAIRILQETHSTPDYTFHSCGGNQFVNNLIYFSRDTIRSLINIGPGTNPDSFHVDSNVWFSDHPSDSSPLRSVPKVWGRQRFMDPQFVDEAAYDFRLKKSSPCAAAGLVVEGSILDFHGIPFGNPPSIGAFEALDESP